MIKSNTLYAKLNTTFKSKENLLPPGKREYDPLNQDRVNNVETVDKIGWVFGGGGARGVFEAGVACALTKAINRPPDLLVGSSVGAINAAGLANGDIKNLLTAWKNLTKENVQTLNLGQITTAGIVRFFDYFSYNSVSNWWKMLGSKNPYQIKSLLNNRPLEQFLERNVDRRLFEPYKTPKAEIAVTVTDVNTGKDAIFATKRLYNGLYKLLETRKQNLMSSMESGIPDISDQELVEKELFQFNGDNVIKGVLASTSIPVIFPAVHIKDDTTIHPSKVRTFIDGCMGNNNPTNVGVSTLMALDHNLKEGVLFVTLLEPRKSNKYIDDKNADIIDLGLKTADLTLKNEAERDVKITQFINNSLDNWQELETEVGKYYIKGEDTNQHINNEVEKLKGLLTQKGIDTNKAEYAGIAESLKELKILGNISGETIEDIRLTLEKYKPFKNKKRIKVVIIRPQEDLGLNIIDFDKTASKATKVIRSGYEATLNSLRQSEIISEEVYERLWKEDPEANLPENLFDKKKK